MCQEATLIPGVLQFSQSNTHIYESDWELAASLLNEPETGRYYLQGFDYDKDTLRVNKSAQLVDYRGNPKKLPKRKLDTKLSVGETDSYNLK